MTVTQLTLTFSQRSILNRHFRPLCRKKTQQNSWFTWLLRFQELYHTPDDQQGVIDKGRRRYHYFGSQQSTCILVDLISRVKGRRENPRWLGSGTPQSFSQHTLNFPHPSWEEGRRTVDVDVFDNTWYSTVTLSSFSLFPGLRDCVYTWYDQTLPEGDLKSLYSCFIWN